MIHLLLKGLYLLPKGMRNKIVVSIGEQFIKRYARLNVHGLENIPKEPVIFVANHLSNADGLLLREVLHKEDPTFIAGVKLSKDLITKLFLEVVPHIAIQPNQPDRVAIKEAIKTLGSNKSIFIFPEGTRSRTGQLIQGRSGVMLIARKANVPIVPIGIEGTEKLLPIKENMSKEWFKEAQVNITIGRPFMLEELEERDPLVDSLMLRIAELIGPEYRGIYR